MKEGDIDQQVIKNGVDDIKEPVHADKKKSKEKRDEKGGTCKACQGKSDTLGRMGEKKMEEMKKVRHSSKESVSGGQYCFQSARRAVQGCPKPKSHI